jgi:capsular exopolysaccharide synthesis family protein
MALFGALGAAVVLAFLRNGMRQSIWGPEELQQAIHPPFLQTLPRISTRRNADPMNDPHLVERVRRLRITLLQCMDPSRGNAIQVTSAEPEAGKSTVAIMLARSLARAGRSVLLVDADLHHPALAERLSMPPDPGFLGALAGSVDDVDPIVETDLPGLDLLPAGRKRHQADPEPVTSGTFEGCLERWRKRYEIILFDSSPILPVADALILAQRVDGTILVAREKHCRRPEIQAAIEDLDRSGGTLLGAVLITSGRYGRYFGGYYKRYGTKYYSAATETDDA